MKTIEERLDELEDSRQHHRQLDDAFDVHEPFTDAEHEALLSAGELVHTLEQSLINDWNYARDALNIEIEERTITHQNGGRYCQRCHCYLKDRHEPGCPVGICIKARNRLNGRTG